VTDVDGQLAAEALQVSAEPCERCSGVPAIRLHSYTLCSWCAVAYLRARRELWAGDAARRDLDTERQAEADLADL
jgi:hypothetical protein